MRKLLFLLFVLVLMSQTAFAEKQEWIDKNYDFKQVKRVLIYNPTVSQKLRNGITEKEIAEIFTDKSKLSNVKIIRIADMVQLIKINDGIDLVSLHNENPQEAANTLIRLTPKYADLVITSTVLEYGTGTQYREGYVYTTTEYQNTYVTSYGGSAVVQSPTTKINSVPGGNVPTAYAAIRWDAYNAKTNQAVLSMTEDRIRANSTVFDNTKPKDIYGRMVGAFFGSVNDKIN